MSAASAVRGRLPIGRGCTRSCARSATRSRRAVWVDGVSSGSAPGVRCTPSSTGSSTSTRLIAARRAPTRSRPSSASAGVTLRVPRSRSSAPTGARCVWPVRSTGSIGWRAGGSPSSTTRAAGQTSYQGLSIDNPLLDGQRLQLPIYAHAARSLLGEDRDVPVESSYWFVKEPKNPRGYLVDLSVEEALDRALVAIVDGIEGGMFVARAPAPGGWGGYIECPYCDPDGLGTTDRHRDWLRKLAAPELAGYLELVGIVLQQKRAGLRRQLALSDGAGDSAISSDAVRTRLDETLFVEAGAGTGKTTVLVDRIVELVIADGDGGPVPMRAVAAITFTEKAAAELRDRVRGRLEERAQRRRSGFRRLRALRGGARRARRGGDLHAARVRAAHPHRVPGGGRAAAAHRSARRSVVAARVRRPLATHPRRPARRSALEPAVLVMLAAGGRLDHLRRVAEFLDDNWDLLDRIGAARCCRTWSSAAGWRSSTPCAEGDHCPTPTTTLLDRLDKVWRTYGAHARTAVDDAARSSCFCRQAVVRGGRLRDGNWPDIRPSRPVPACSTSSAPRSVNRCHQRRAAPSRRVPGGPDRGNTATRRRAGELEFHDLLVLGARLVARDPERGRGRYGADSGWYQRLLVDEFQDTDPIQVEIATLLAGADDDAGLATGRTHRTWSRGGCSSSATPSSRSTASGEPTSRPFSRRAIGSRRSRFVSRRTSVLPSRCWRGSITCSGVSSSPRPVRSPTTSCLTRSGSRLRAGRGSCSSASTL